MPGSAANKIAYQGVPGANSHMSCLAVYPDREPVSCQSFEDAFAAVSDRAAEIAMIPIIKFDTVDVTVPAGQPVTLTADNADPGIPHNWAVYTDDSASELIAGTPICTDCTETITFDAPEPGVYFFKCDVHPVQMVGTFTVE